MLTGPTKSAGTNAGSRKLVREGYTFGPLGVLWYSRILSSLGCNSLRTVSALLFIKIRPQFSCYRW